jgi:hypothetical protein
MNGKIEGSVAGLNEVFFGLQRTTQHLLFCFYVPYGDSVHTDKGEVSNTAQTELLYLTTSRIVSSNAR